MEKALVLISIVLGVAITFELENLNRLLRSENVRWHWAQALFALWTLIIVIAFWWMIAGSPNDKLSVGAFMPIMFVLVLLVLMSAVALPDKVPEDGLDMAEYYLENRRYQWSLMLGVMLPLAINWLVVLYGRGGLIFAITRGWGEWLPVLLTINMIFARKWWHIALGFAALSFVPVAFMSRTL